MEEKWGTHSLLWTNAEEGERRKKIFGVTCNALIPNCYFLVVLHNLFEFINNYVICGVLFDLYSFI